MSGDTIHRVCDCFAACRESDGCLPNRFAIECVMCLCRETALESLVAPRIQMSSSARSMALPHGNGSHDQ